MTSTRLKSARAYWRIAAKFGRAGNGAQERHYRQVAERFYQMYLREREAAERRKGA